ncbi:uncharacterized protein LOC132750584 [Ruditapes philippinarum]|uniref:uncharacterized protein LOC132750584 n=1 Tax=Ruditapes philippinarum TaxID=129788 RepID=UPI00295C37E6|nr:uncharacterized protein LOC132750584 [Ruditapes philippinarum]
MAKASKEMQMDELGDRVTGKLNPSLEKTLFDKKVEEFLEYSIKEVGDNKSNVKFETSKDDLPDVYTNSEVVLKSNNMPDENCAMIKMISEKMSAEYGLKPDNKGDASNIVDSTKEDSGKSSDIKERSAVTSSISTESSKSETNLSQAEVFKSPPGLGGPDSCLYSKVIEKKSTNEPVVGMQNDQVVSFTPPVAGIPFIHPFIDPGIYQAVEAQLKMLYPEIASNPAILTQVAIQQTCILQMCLNSQTGDVNQAHGNVNQVERGTDQCSLPDGQPLRLPGKPTLHEQGGLPTPSSDVQKGQTIPTLDKQLRQPISQSDMQKGQSIPTLDRQLKQPISQSDMQKGPPISTLDKQLRQPISQSDMLKGQSIPTLDRQLKQPISQSDLQKGPPISTLDKQLRQPISQSDVHKNQPIPSSDWQGRQTFPPSATRRTPISSMDRQGEQELPPSDRQRKQISGKYIQEPHNYPNSPQKEKLG